MFIDKSGREGEQSAELGKRARTRVKLIEATAAVISEKGFDRASLEEIAERAGMSRGAVYGNFKNKEELFLALVQSRWKPIVPPLQPGASLETYMTTLGRTVAAEALARLPDAAIATSFQLYICTHPAMRATVSERNASVYAAMVKAVAKAFPGGMLPMAPRRFVRVMDALITGLLFTYFQTPDLFTEDDFVAAFEVFGRDTLQKAKREGRTNRAAVQASQEGRKKRTILNSAASPPSRRSQN